MAQTGDKQPPAAPPSVAKTGGGGDDDDRRNRPVDSDVAVALGKCRKEAVTCDEFEFHPLTLVGSWFHRLENEEMVWQGVIVGEPAPGSYLVQIDRMEPGADGVQKLVSLNEMAGADEEMSEWRFYDSEQDAKSAYGHWLATERERG